MREQIGFNLRDPTVSFNSDMKSPFGSKVPITLVLGVKGSTSDFFLRLRGLGGSKAGNGGGGGGGGPVPAQISPAASGITRGTRPGAYQISF